MQDERPGRCEDIRSNLKSFLDDLLSEEEYQRFCDHLETCPQCRKYVAAIGSLSNQMWELGDIKVPNDLASTALYKYSQQPSPSADTSASGAGKWVKTAIVIAVVVIAGLFVRSSKRGQKRPLPTPPAPMVSKTVTTEEPLTDYTYTDTDTKRDVRPAARDPEKAKVDIAFETSEGEVRMSRDDASGVTTSKFTPLPLHWHLRHSDEAANRELLTAMSSASVRAGHNSREMVLFSATGKQITRILEYVILRTRDSYTLKDFTADRPTFPDLTSAVSVYFNKQEATENSWEISRGVHWHVHIVRAQQRERIRDLVKKRSHEVIHDSETLLIVTVRGAELHKLKAGIRAIRVEMEEFGRKLSEEDAPAVGLVPVSVYIFD